MAVSVEVEREARRCATLAIELELGRAAWSAEVYALQGVGRLETYYGRAWRSPPHAPDVVGGNNIGAVQCRAHWAAHRRVFGVGPRPDLSRSPVPSAVAGCCALVVDSSPTAAGPSWYAGPYRTHADPVEGWRLVARTLTRMAVIGDGGAATNARTVEAVSRRMYQARYYQGVHTDPELAIADHVAALSRAVATIASVLEDHPGLALPGHPIPPAVRLASASPAGPALPGPPPVVGAEETLEAGTDALLEGGLERRRAARDAELGGRDE